MTEPRLAISTDGEVTLVVSEDRVYTCEDPNCDEVHISLGEADADAVMMLEHGLGRLALIPAPKRGVRDQ